MIAILSNIMFLIGGVVMVWSIWVAMDKIFNYFGNRRADKELDYTRKYLREAGRIVEKNDFDRDVISEMEKI